MELYNNIMILVTAFLLFSLPVVFIISRWNFSRNFVNFGLLAQILHSEPHQSLFYNKIVQGHYKGRKITCRTAWERVFGTVGWSTQENGYRPIPSQRCPLELYIEPNTKQQKKTLTHRQGLSQTYATQKITDYTHLYHDGRIYFTYMPLRDYRKNFWTGIPEPNADDDKKSLWGLLRIKLSHEEIKTFLEELTRAAEILETKNS